MDTKLQVLRQHMIDPEVCIRCNTCEETCPTGAITHDASNYVVAAEKCNACLACIAPCPTGAIDNWRTVLREKVYTVDEQYTWNVLPGEAVPDRVGSADHSAGFTYASVEPAPWLAPVTSGSTVPPWSACSARVNLYARHQPAIATVIDNRRLTEEATETDTHHIVLDFGGAPFPVLEGQSIGILPPGSDKSGRPHHARQYSIASPRDGERPGRNNVSLTVKRISADHEGRPVRGVCSNYLCDLRRGEVVRVIGPFGDTFLMPNHSPSHLLMICTGTGSAPMRAMTERRRRRRDQGDAGRLMLFFGARRRQELPYFGPLMNLPRDFIDVNLAFSREPGQAKRYVQDRMRERAAAVAELLRDDNTYVYVCGVRGMESGVLGAMRDAVSLGNGLEWQPLEARLRAEGRLHVETY
jgi:benzoyl-CoA oxygenase/reductase BoxA protein